MENGERMCVRLGHVQRATLVGAWPRAYRCVACGNVSGWVVERNRQMREKAAATDKLQVLAFYPDN